MIEKTIGEIEAKIRGAETVSDERKRELLQLLARLKNRGRRAVQNARRTGGKHRGVRAVVGARSHARRAESASCASCPCAACSHPSRVLRSPTRTWSKSSTASATRCRTLGFDFQSFSSSSSSSNIFDNRGREDDDEDLIQSSRGSSFAIAAMISSAICW